VLVWRKTKFANKLFWRSEFWIIFIASLFILHFVIFFFKNTFFENKMIYLDLCTKTKSAIVFKGKSLFAATALQYNLWYVYNTAFRGMLSGWFFFYLKKFVNLKTVLKSTFVHTRARRQYSKVLVPFFGCLNFWTNINAYFLISKILPFCQDFFIDCSSFTIKCRNGFF